MWFAERDDSTLGMFLLPLCTYKMTQDAIHMHDMHDIDFWQIFICKNMPQKSARYPCSCRLVGSPAGVQRRNLGRSGAVDAPAKETNVFW